VIVVCQILLWRACQTSFGSIGVEPFKTLLMASEPAQLAVLSMAWLASLGYGKLPPVVIEWLYKLPVVALAGSVAV